MASYIGPPPGTVFSFAGSVAPTGYLICDGSSLLRATYADLFAAIGTTYGSADGTHFNLPDVRGRMPVGLGTHTAVNALSKNELGTTGTGGQAVGDRRPQHRTTNSLSATQTAHSHAPASPHLGGGSGGNAFFIGNVTAGPYSLTTGGGTGQTTTLLDSIAPAIQVNGSLGTNVANDALDTPSFIVVAYIIKT